jgi:hypothetical protein
MGVIVIFNVDLDLHLHANADVDVIQCLLLPSDERTLDFEGGQTHSVSSGDEGGKVVFEEFCRFTRRIRRVCEFL